MDTRSEEKPRTGLDQVYGPSGCSIGVVFLLFGLVHAEAAGAVELWGWRAGKGRGGRTWLPRDLVVVWLLFGPWRGLAWMMSGWRWMVIVGDDRDGEVECGIPRRHNKMGINREIKSREI